MSRLVSEASRVMRETYIHSEISSKVWLLSLKRAMQVHSVSVSEIYCHAGVEACSCALTLQGKQKLTKVKTPHITKVNRTSSRMIFGASSALHASLGNAM